MNQGTELSPQWHRCEVRDCHALDSEFMLIRVDGRWVCRICAAKLQEKQEDQAIEVVK